MTKELVSFETMPIRDRQRIYAFCYGNPMSIAQYMNIQVNGVMEGQDGYSYFQDILTYLESCPEEDKKALESAKEVMIDKVVWDTFKEKSPSFVKNIAEKTHPSYKSKGLIGDVGGVKITVEHIVKAAQLAGESPKKYIDDMQIETDAEVVSG